MNEVNIISREMTGKGPNGYFSAMAKAKQTVPNGEEVGERLLGLRKLAGMKQGEFAKQIGVAANTYNQWEKGKQPPELPNGIAICRALGVTLDYLYLGNMHGLHPSIYARLTGIREVPAGSPLFEHPDLPATSSARRKG